MRYWFILVIGLMLAVAIFVSASDYKDRRQALGRSGKFIGYVQVEEGLPSSQGVRVGLLPENLLGSSRRCDVVLPAPSVEKVHAHIYVQEGRTLVEPVEGSPLLINGRKALRTYLLCSGDYLTLGEVTLLVYLREEEDND